ncbi:ABC transporter ATP-binding protein [Fictibacillus nanhaiensis]|uniref:ABC transporter ATP-binding protein n=1 Tax=Fictibacillus nanhaiensis TaxID=742169 RepID=UPI002E1E170D|nr:ABC transporter ATP-binding protein [Fictibacillus nanhaiensis]
MAENKTTTTGENNLLLVENLSVTVRNSGKKLIQNLNFSIPKGEIFGLVGESGSGKSLTATVILGMLSKSLEVTSGTVKLGQSEITSLSEKELRNIRGHDSAYLSQNYQSFFTPFIKVGKQFIEIIRCHTNMSRKEAKKVAIHWLNRVHLPAERVFNSYPDELSGGQLQRASIASAIMFRPKLIIADEPTTALDVLTGERILDLLCELKEELNCSILLISHDLRHIINRTQTVGVMYGGQIVEIGKTSAVVADPIHPYTNLLLQSRLKLSNQPPLELQTMLGEPGLIAEEGCPFSKRCPSVMKSCSNLVPMNSIGTHHSAACHLVKAEREERYVTH